ncbi:hypothetical protein BTVI_02325 [Pitangus sulphuratus]|nr:hypothetical protein BTVI_02325 [Pitangus sulphuratus]
MECCRWTAAGTLLLASLILVAINQDALVHGKFSMPPGSQEGQLCPGGHQAKHRQLVKSSRTARSEEDRDSLWDAWGSWSECSRTCGGGASYSLRRCLSSNEDRKQSKALNRSIRILNIVCFSFICGQFGLLVQAFIELTMYKILLEEKTGKGIY